MTRMVENASCQKANTNEDQGHDGDKHFAETFAEEYLMTLGNFWGGNCTGYVLGLYNFSCVVVCFAIGKHVTR